MNKSCKIYRVFIRLLRPSVLSVFVLFSVCALSQPVNNTHDNVRINQFWKAVNGTGNLDMAYWWYLTMHSSYYRTATVPNSKAALAGGTLAETSVAKDVAEEISDTLYTLLAPSSVALAEGKSNIAWQTVSSLFERKYQDIDRLFTRFTSYGCTAKQKQYFEMCYNRIKEGVSVANGGFQTTGARKQQLDGLYEDLCRLFQDMLDCCSYASAVKGVARDSSVLKSKPYFRLAMRKDTICILRHNLWRQKYKEFANTIK